MTDRPPYPDTENNTKMYGWDDETQQWILIGEAPALPPPPHDDKPFIWNEETQQWVEFTGA